MEVKPNEFLKYTDKFDDPNLPGTMQAINATLTASKINAVVEGRPNKLIADALGISVRTVEVHRARVFDKMEVKSAVELANLLRSL